MMAIGRFATAALCATAALGACGGRNEAAAAPPEVPILLYHHIGNPPPGERAPSLYVTRQQLSGQLTALQRAGFEAVTLQRVWNAWHGRGRLPSRPVVLSFDDGYAEQDAIVRPALTRRRWAGVLNLTLNRVGARGGLTRSAVERLRRAGWEIDDHTTTHPDLTKVSAARLRTEVAASRAAFRRLFGLSPRFFCYPYGRSNPAVRRAVRAAGFVAATTIRPGLASARQDPFALPRIVIRRAMTPTQLVRAARG